jgi:hypothetical protein
MPCVHVQCAILICALQSVSLCAAAQQPLDPSIQSCVLRHAHDVGQRQGVQAPLQDTPVISGCAVGLPLRPSWPGLRDGPSHGLAHLRFANICRSSRTVALHVQ